MFIKCHRITKIKQQTIFQNENKVLLVPV